MKATIIVFILVVIVAGTSNVVIKQRREISELQYAISVLERELLHNQVMLDDAHRYYPLLERRVLQVETDYTAREIIWMMQDIFGDCDMVEVY